MSASKRSKTRPATRSTAMHLIVCPALASRVGLPYRRCRRKAGFSLGAPPRNPMAEVAWAGAFWESCRSECSGRGLIRCRGRGSSSCFRTSPAGRLSMLGLWTQSWRPVATHLLPCSCSGIPPSRRDSKSPSHGGGEAPRHAGVIPALLNRAGVQLLRLCCCPSKVAGTTSGTRRRRDTRCPIPPRARVRARGDGEV
jgi:hypothetical protein